MSKHHRKTNAAARATRRRSSRRHVRGYRADVATRLASVSFQTVLDAMRPGDVVVFGDTKVTAEEALSGCVYKLTRA